jgi:hypothetical protein
MGDVSTTSEPNGVLMAVATFTADMCSMRVAIYKPLAQLLRLRALAALQKVLNGGSACSRRGTSRASGARHAAAMLASLFTPQGWEDTQKIAGSLDVLDNPVLAYERQSLEGLSDTIKIAVVMQWTPVHVRNPLEGACASSRQQLRGHKDPPGGLHDVQV